MVQDTKNITTAHLPSPVVQPSGEFSKRGVGGPDVSRKEVVGQDNAGRGRWKSCSSPRSQPIVVLHAAALVSAGQKSPRVLWLLRGAEALGSEHDPLGGGDLLRQGVGEGEPQQFVCGVTWETRHDDVFTQVDSAGGGQKSQSRVQQLSGTATVGGVQGLQLQVCERLLQLLEEDERKNPDTRP